MQSSLRRRIRILLGLFIVGLVLSGLTAFPLVFEIELINPIIGEGTFMERVWPAMAHWITHVHLQLTHAQEEHSILLYGTDWLAFAHIVIAISFIGPLRDPVRNVWVIEFGMVACVLVVPLALVCGPIRGIPFYWRLIDCSFGLFGIIPLWLARRTIMQITRLESTG